LPTAYSYIRTGPGVLSMVLAGGQGVCSWVAREPYPRAARPGGPVSVREALPVILRTLAEHFSGSAASRAIERGSGGGPDGITACSPDKRPAAVNGRTGHGSLGARQVARYVPAPSARHRHAPRGGVHRTQGRDGAEGRERRPARRTCQGPQPRRRRSTREGAAATLARRSTCACRWIGGRPAPRGLSSRNVCVAGSRHRWSRASATVSFALAASRRITASRIASVVLVHLGRGSRGGEPVVGVGRADWEPVRCGAIRAGGRGLRARGGGPSRPWAGRAW
jgi:hypothetical protein